MNTPDSERAVDSTCAFDSMHVTLVGLDRYGAGVASLTNPETRPSSVVLDYATWLQGRVDAANIFVFLSDVDEHDKDVVEALVSLDVPVTHIRNGTNDNVRDYCKTTLAASPQSNLLWVWCGHGFLYRRDGLRIVYCSDTGIDDLRGFSLQDLENYLRDIKIKNLERQLLIWDTCSVGTDRPHGVNKPPSITKFKLPAKCVQEPHYAAQYELTAKTGQKSRSILTNLQALDDPAIWPPDLPRAERRWGDSGKQATFEAELQDHLSKPDRLVVLVGGNSRERPQLNDTEIAEQIADYGDRYYPFFDTHILSQVAEYLVQTGQPKDALDAFREACQLHLEGEAASESAIKTLTELRMIADLQVDIFVTTSYDNTLSGLVAESRGVDPIIASFGESFSDLPTIGRPLVYHLYGRVDDRQPRGVVTAITELQIRERNLKIVTAGTGAAGEDHPFPECVLAAIGDRRHLYVGFDLRDRVLRGLLHSLKCANLGEGNEGYAINPAFGQVRPNASDEDAHAFLDRYLTEMGPCNNVKILWEFPTTALAGVSFASGDA